jgi:hypothetical protein
VTTEERRALAERALGGMGSTTSLVEALAAAGLRLVGPHEDGQAVRRWDVLDEAGRLRGSRWSPQDMLDWIRERRGLEEPREVARG